MNIESVIRLITRVRRNSERNLIDINNERKQYLE